MEDSRVINTGNQAVERNRVTSPSLLNHPATKLALETAIAQRSLDPAVLDVRGISTIADYFIVVSGTSQRHLQGIADKIEAALKEIGEQPLSISGYENGEWIVLDYGDLIVHALYEPARQFYNLDGLWATAPRISLGPELEEEARRLRTGTIR